tara:strand:+ start:12264 stop:15470 length:3207 start_codon:yes stop_codon:yes gene_type:complete
MAKSKYRGSARGGGFNALTPPYGIIREQQRQSAETIRGLENQQRQTDARAAKAERDLERVQSREEANQRENRRLEQTYFNNQITGLERNKTQQLQNDLNIARRNAAKERQLSDLAELAPSILEKVTEANDIRNKAIEDNAYNYFIAQGLPEERQAASNLAQEAVEIKSEEIQSQADAMADAGAPLRVTSNFRQLSKYEELGRVKAYIKMAEADAQGWVNTWMRESGINVNDPTAVAAELDKALPAFMRKYNLQNAPLDLLGELFTTLRTVRNDTTREAEDRLIIEQDQYQLQGLKIQFRQNPNPKTGLLLFQGLKRYTQPDGKSGDYRSARLALFEELKDLKYRDYQVREILEGIPGQYGSLAYEFENEFKKLMEDRQEAKRTLSNNLTQQKTARDDELIRLAKESARSNKNFTKLDLDFQVKDLLDRNVDREKVNEFQEEWLKQTASEVEKAKNAEQLYAKEKQGILIVEDVQRYPLPPEDYKKLMELAVAREEKVLAKAISRDLVEKMFKEAINETLGRPLVGEAVLGRAAALDFAMTRYQANLMDGIVNIEPSKIRTYSESLANSIKQEILNKQGDFRVANQVVDMGKQVNASGRGRNRTDIGVPKYFPRFEPPTISTPSGTATVELNSEIDQRAALVPIIKALQANPNFINQHLMIPEAQLEAIYDKLNSGEKVEIPEVYYYAAKATKGRLSAREALTINIKSIKPDFVYPDSDLQKLMRTEGANDPQLQQYVLDADSIDEEFGYAQVFQNGTTQRQYMSDDVANYQEVAGGLSALSNAIIEQESGGDPLSMREDSQVFGMGQIAKTNIGPWTKKHLGYTMTPEQFRRDADAQRTVINGELRDRLRQYRNEGYTGEELIRRVAASWYGGPGAVDNWDDPNYKGFHPSHPNMQEYTKKVYERFNANGGFGTQATKTGENTGIVVTDSFDADPGQGGIDFAIGNGAPKTPFYFPFQTKVVKIVTGNDERILVEKGDTRKSPGNYVELTVTAPNGYKFDMRCAHFDRVNGSLRVGQQLPAGAFIGTQGRSGSTTGYHVSCDAYGVGNSIPDPRGNRIFLEYLKGARQ